MLQPTSIASTSMQDDSSQPENSPHEFYGSTSSDYNIFITGDTTSKIVEEAAINPVMNNLFDRTKAAYIRFNMTKVVNNPILHESFERCRDKLRAEGKSTQNVYGFIQLPNGDNGEEEDLCRYGVRVGMNYRGELGDASKGVYLSKFADTCTPSAFINDQTIRILVCKVLLGKQRSAMPSPSQQAWTSQPDANFNSVVATQPQGNPKPEVARYRQSLMYVYEFTGQSTSDRPASIYPLSVVEIQCNKPGPDLLNILVPRNLNSNVWTGTLYLQKNTLKHVTMHSHFANVGRPRGMDTLQFKTMVPYDTVAECLPIRRLIQDDMTGALLLKSEITLGEQAPIYIQYFVLKCDECELFDSLCTLMRKFELVGVNKLPTGSTMFLIPNGGLSTKLGLCLFNTASFHCVVMSQRSANLANSNWQADPFEIKSPDLKPRQTIRREAIRRRAQQLLPPLQPAKRQMKLPDMSVPPPNFSVPPPQISPLGPYSTPIRGPPPPIHMQAKRFSTGSNESATSPTIPPLSSLFVPRPESGAPEATTPSIARAPVRVDATPKAMDRLLGEMQPPKHTAPVPNAATATRTKSVSHSALDPRLAMLQRRDPKRFNELMNNQKSPPEALKPVAADAPPTLVAFNAGGEEAMEIDSDGQSPDIEIVDPNRPSTSLASATKQTGNKAMITEDITALLHQGRWPNAPAKSPANGKPFEAPPASARTRSMSSDDEGRLEIIENVDAKEVEQLRSPPHTNNNNVIPQSNGRHPIASPPSTDNAAISNNHRARQSRFGPRAGLSLPPTLLRPAQIPSGPPQSEFFMNRPPPVRQVPPSMPQNQRRPPPLYPPSMQQQPTVEAPKMQGNYVVILDPDIIISPVLQPDQLERLFSIARDLNKRRGGKFVAFKWHRCIGVELAKQINDAPKTFLSERAQRFMELEKGSTDIIDVLGKHLCDEQTRSAPKNLICGMNIERANREAKVVFLSAVITPGVGAGSNFESNNIHLRNPEQMTAELAAL